MAKKLLFAALCFVLVLIALQTPDQVVRAQAPGPVADWKACFWGQYNRIVFLAILENGDVYFRDFVSSLGGTPLYSGNFWEGVAIPTSPIQKWDHFEAGDRRTTIYVFLENGDVYMRGCNFELNGILTGTPGNQFLGNFWGGAVPTTHESWGKVKDAYRGKD